MSLADSHPNFLPDHLPLVGLGNVTVVLGDNLHEMSNPIFWEKKKKKHILKCLLKTFN